MHQFPVVHSLRAPKLAAAWLGFVLLISSCARCQGTPERPHTKREIDLRSTLLIAFPEYRGAQVTSGSARLTRTVKGSASEAEAAALKTLEANQFTRNGQLWSRPPYTAWVSGSTWAVSVPLDDATVGKLYMAPTSMSSGDLAMWYPREPAKFAIEREVFDFELHYEATPDRAAFLTRQLIRLLLGSGQWRALEIPSDWDVDGGQPPEFDARLEQLSTHATLKVHRAASAVTVEYSLVTDEP